MYKQLVQKIQALQVVTGKKYGIHSAHNFVEIYDTSDNSVYFRAKTYFKLIAKINNFLYYNQVMEQLTSPEEQESEESVITRLLS